MRIVRTIILCLFVNLPLFGIAQDVSYSKKEVEEVLVSLDSVIAHKKKYQTIRQHRVDSLEQVVNSCHISVYVDKCKELYQALSCLDGRKALKALDRIKKTEEYQEDKNLQAWVKLNASSTYGIMGLYYLADNLVASVDPSEISKKEQLHYYMTCKDN